MANVHPVNKIVYIIIAFFLGGLGIQPKSRFIVT